MPSQLDWLKGVLCLTHCPITSGFAPSGPDTCQTANRQAAVLWSIFPWGASSPCARHTSFARGLDSQMRWNLNTKDEKERIWIPPKDRGKERKCLLALIGQPARHERQKCVGPVGSLDRLKQPSVYPQRGLGPGEKWPLWHTSPWAFLFFSQWESTGTSGSGTSKVRLR